MSTPKDKPLTGKDIPQVVRDRVEGPSRRAQEKKAAQAKADAAAIARLGRRA